MRELILSVVVGGIMCAMSYRIVHLYQRHNYLIKDTLRSIGLAYIFRLIIVGILSLAVMGVCYILERGYHSNDIRYIGVVFFVSMSVVVYVLDRIAPLKTPLKYTPRIKRLYATIYLLCSVCAFGVASISVFVLPISIVLPPICTILADIVNTPIENCIKARYIHITKQRLEARADLIKIGITGSFGKTSVKNILASMLESKYNVLVSPMNYNTPMGISRTVGLLEPRHEVLICEMGARHIGDIMELCDIVHPTIGIITGITSQHIETFLNIANIISTKRELIEALPLGGKAYINNDTTNSSDFLREGILTTITGKGTDIYADDIQVGSKGSDFTLHIRGEDIRVHTKLLGYHNISNILLSCSVAYDMGISIDDIAHSIEVLEPTPHRLEVIPNARGICIIDDTYNANIEGCKCALEVLSLYKGRKIILTPGMVELGAIEYESNMALGRDIGRICDKVILIGEKRTTPIREGLEQIGYDMRRVEVYSSLDDARAHFGSVLKRGDTLLMLNDLPDEYSETK